MSKREIYESRTEALLLPLMEEFGFELVDVEYVKEGGSWYLRAYIDKEGGITVNDCEAVARRMNDLLDEEDFIEESYIFEVSSPGLTRPLKKEKDYEKSIGRLLDIKLYKPVEGKKEYAGILKEYNKDIIIIESDDTQITIERSNLAMIRWAYVD